ncbi:broad specificity phosphatase PhoE [Friedmanniella endophytica]|uniref:Broad specificity phosphatase PhoE n=1 Tax=Microlunatus kandeliicorticis TaxID=1759536 RepID=A0A7W3P7M7_9ACTN|nr:histidine phosphatase family protein [Microlunatus kandeliicorticis]MBA8796184.1 broad specificity phosphatase PhoE [Microlunatus kandeliicorticis]
MSGERTVVHLMRHGQVENPHGVLYGRLPGYHLSELGRRMALQAAESFRGLDLVHLRCSPLERAQETIAPVVEIVDLPVITDGRVIEADNYLEGRTFSAKNSALKDPRTWRYLRNPLKPSWGEPYRQIVARMRAAIADAREAAAGHEALIVSHQLPIWMARCDAEGRRLAHDPRRRECTLASVTSLTFQGSRLTAVSYREPVADLLPGKERSTKFVAGA